MQHTSLLPSLTRATRLAAALATATSALGLVELHRLFKPLTMLLAVLLVLQRSRNERLLVGALPLPADQVRRSGLGQLLGTTLEAEALDALGPAGGALAAGSAFGFGVAAGWGMVFTFSNGAVS